MRLLRMALAALTFAAFFLLTLAVRCAWGGLR
jgi:hypothetical protein